MARAVEEIVSFEASTSVTQRIGLLEVSAEAFPRLSYMMHSVTKDSVEVATRLFLELHFRFNSVR